MATGTKEGDAELVAGLRRGDAGAFDEAYARLHGRIFSFLVRLAGRRDLAQDLSQETWMQLARAAPRLREDTDLAALLFTVARNRYRSHCRWQVVDLGRLRAARALRDERDGGRPDDQAAAGAALQRLQTALSSLPGGAREVVLLCAVEGLSPEEVGPILGLRPDAVRQRLSRARAQLAAVLEPRARGQGGPR